MTNTADSNNDYPLYPTLTEEGKEEAQKIMDGFKAQLTGVIEEILGTLYTDVSYHIESDHWDNYRNELMNGFRNYQTKKHEHDFKDLRQAIYANHKDEIVRDLNQDLLEENKRLKKQIKTMTEYPF